MFPYVTATVDIFPCVTAAGDPEARALGGGGRPARQGRQAAGRSEEGAAGRRGARGTALYIRIPAVNSLEKRSIAYKGPSRCVWIP